MRLFLACMATFMLLIATPGRPRASSGPPGAFIAPKINPFWPPWCLTKKDFRAWASNEWQKTVTFKDYVARRLADPDNSIEEYCYWTCIAERAVEVERIWDRVDWLALYPEDDKHYQILKRLMGPSWVHGYKAMPTLYEFAIRKD